MKISITDVENGRFSGYLRDHWTELGHEVVLQGGYNPEKADWADLIWIDWTDLNVQLAASQEWFDKTPHERFSRPIIDRDKKKLINRMIDIDMWSGHGAGVKWEGVDDLVFVAPHIQRLANQRFASAGIRDVSQHLIRLGVDLDKWNFRDRRTDKVKNIAFVGELWENKGIDRALRILIQLVRQSDTNWRLHLKGRWPNANYFYHYNQNLIDSNGVRELITFYEDFIPDMNDWYSQMDYILVPSIKEAFSYVTAECMSKGIKPVINRFYGAPEIWPEKYIFDTESEAVKMLLSSEYNPEEYRYYIAEHYDIKRMFSEVDKICELS